MGRRVDAMIIGGGLAGLHLSLAMIRAGMDPLLIDQAHPMSSSRVAAGMINPITGRRFALSWMYDELESVFAEAYGYWEKKWHCSFFEKIKIYRSVPDHVLVNDLDARLHDPRYSQYCKEMTAVETEDLHSLIRFDHPGYVFDGFRLDTVTFLDQGIGYMKSRNRYICEKFEAGEKISGGEEFSIEGFVSDKIIYCTGTNILDHAFSKGIRMEPNKGEVLLLEVEHGKFQKIIKHKLFYVPVAENLIWAGAYNTREYEDEKPSEAGYKYLSELVRENLMIPYRIKSHLSALRPTMKDNRPVIGAHPDHSGVYFFNGFGSKGSSLIPYFARYLVDVLQGKDEWIEEVRIDRFF